MLSPAAWFADLKCVKRLTDCRYGIQLTVLTLCCGWIACVPRVNERLFGNNGRWVVGTAVPMLDMNVGSTYQRAVMRGLGVGVACVVVLIIVSIARHNREPDEVHMSAKLAVYLVLPICGFFYNWMYLFSSELFIAATSASSFTPLLLGYSFVADSPLSYIILRCLAVMLGITACTFVSRTLLPAQSRVSVVQNLCKIIDHFCETFEPLLLMQAGIVEIDEFLYHDNAEYLSNKELYERRRMQLALWRDKRDLLWSNLEAAGTLISKQLNELKLARYEVSLRHKRSLNEEIYKQILLSVRTMYFELCSIYFNIDARIGARHEDPNELRLLAVHVTPAEHQEDDALDLNLITEYYKSKLQNRDSYCYCIMQFVENIVMVLNIYKVQLRLSMSSDDAEKYIQRAADALELFHERRAERQRMFPTFVDYAVKERAVRDAPRNKNFYLKKIEKLAERTSINYFQMTDAQNKRFWESYWHTKNKLSISDSNLMSLFATTRVVTYNIKNLIRARHPG